MFCRELYYIVFFLPATCLLCYVFFVKFLLNDFFLLTFITVDIVGYVVELLAGIILGLISLDTVVAAIKKTVRKRLSVQKETFTGTCIIITVTKPIQIPLSRNLD